MEGGVVGGAFGSGVVRNFGMSDDLLERAALIAYSVLDYKRIIHLTKPLFNLERLQQLGQLT